MPDKIRLKNHKILIFACNPVPAPSTMQVEGTGLRYWRMALGLKAVGYTDITVAVLAKFAPKEKEHAGIKIISFEMDKQDYRRLLSRYDTVIYSYAYGLLPLKVIESAPAKVQLITDAYSPYYVEALMKAGNVSDEITAKYYDEQVFRCNLVLSSSDYVLYAGKQQKLLYEGVLAGLGILGRFTDRLLDLPGYVEMNKLPPPPERDGKLTVLWFGGMYPWFDASKLAEIFADKRISRIAKLLVVGGYNPNYPKTDKRHNGQFFKFYKIAQQQNLLNRIIYVKDWVDYEQRLSIFRQSDIALSINQLGIETRYSFRIRVADLAGNGVPLITNGGDPLSERLISKGASFYVDFRAPGVVDSLLELLRNKESIEKARQKLISGDLYKQLHIENNLQLLIDVIESESKPRLDDHLSADRARSLNPKYVQSLSTEKAEALKKIENLQAELNSAHHNIEEQNRIIADTNRQIAHLSRILRDPVYASKAVLKKLKKAKE